MSDRAAAEPEPTRVRLRLAVPAGVPVVLGESDALGGGEPNRGLRLRERGPGIWEAEAALPAGVEYGLVLLDPAAGARLDDEGFARQARPSALPRQPDGQRLLEQAWRATLVRFAVAHRVPAGQRLAVVGDGAALGDWRDPSPLEAVSGDGRDRWEGLVAIGEPYGEVTYRYVALDGRARWERERNRHVAVPPPWEVANGLVATGDANVVTGLDLDWITDGIALGPYPQSGDDAARLEGLLAHGHRVYVHCTAGMGRSPAVVVVHLVGRGATLEEADRLVRDRHPESVPNLDAVARAAAARRRR